MRRNILLVFLFSFLCSQNDVLAQERGFVAARQQSKDYVALVIGNSNYPDAPLINPKNDAQAVAGSFKKMGFIVELVLDADKEQMAMAIDRFSSQLYRAKAAVFYFAGHGMQVDGINYLIPVTKTEAGQITKEEQVPYRAVNAGEVLDIMKSNEVMFSLVVLDACRNNPIAGGARGKLKGLASINAPVGSLVMYSTSAGDVAQDGTEANSPFTKAFLQHIQTPGLDVNVLSSKVTKTVQELTSGQQIPGSYSSLNQSFTFVPEYTKDEFDALQKQQQGELTELQKKQAEIDRLRELEEQEMKNKQAALDLLEKQINEMKTKTASGEGDLDKMIQIIEERKKQKDEYDALKEKLAKEQAIRQAQMLAMKKKEYYSNIEKYNKIAESGEFGAEFKPEAWKTVLRNLGVSANIPIGDSVLVMEELGLMPTRYIETATGVPFEMVAIKGGSFKIESGANETKITLKDFYMGQTEVTFAEYDAFCAATNRQKPDDATWGRGTRPVINVSWDDAKAYCAWLSQKTGKNYRLPSEAEWEYAAGGGALNRTKWAGTNDESSLGEYAVYLSNSGSKTASVKSKKPNALGLYDMSGNVWEWCEDDWHGSYNGMPKDGSAWVDNLRGSYRVLRGGSWNNYPYFCRVAYRYYNYPTDRDSYLGFRLVLSF